MLTLLLGDDQISKRQYLDQELAKFGGEVTIFQVDDGLPKLTSLSAASLFGPGGAYVFFDCAKQYESADFEAASGNAVPIYFVEESLDKRLKKTKDLLALAKTKEFIAPTLEQAPNWILKYAEAQGIAIQPQATMELAKRLLGQSRKSLSTLAAHNELLKLASFAEGKTITKSMVEELTPQDLSIDLLNLMDLIASNNKGAAITMVQQYYVSTTEDDKQATIKLSALLSEQLRALYIAKELFDQGLTDQAVISATGWKSGRLFFIKKLLPRFTTAQLSSALTKFYNLDKEIKSSTMPPQVIAEMIVASF